ncbi:biotin transporter BioY [Massilimicrobiota timonensis]|uniref:Biotin transporter n=1 Tax=Massilimicrobiota timonensis TaxID=1776392 RepID=A0ABT7UHS1_9FIRM|nr:biotin transporter BioY [Massilimicrobiota timonensis]MDM8195689.1 biotin transporter BioY [Massilimicrobiota timonensis]
MEYIKDTDSNKTRDIVYMSVFTAMISICSWISIPASIPFTLQTMGVFTTVGLLGGKRGTLTVLTYILLGAIGIPVFAGLTGGVSVLLGTTGGYIMGFLLSALLMWGIETIMGRNQIVLAFSMVAGLIVCYVFGTAWFMLIYTQHSGVIGLSTVLGLCVIPFIIPDLIKIGVALFLTNRLKKR